MQNRNIILIAIIAVFLLGALCVCAGASALLGYQFFDSEFGEVLSDPDTLIDAIQSQDDPPAPVETLTPLDQDIDLAKLFEPLWESRQLLHEDFVEQPVDDDVLAMGAVQGLSDVLAEQGVALEEIEAPAGSESAASLSAAASTPEEAQTAFEPFWEAWRKAQYGKLEVESSYEDLMRSSLRGMVAALGDPHTSYLDPVQLQQSDLSLQGEYEGIGAWVDPSAEYLTIIAPMEGSPAEAAGLMPGDRVIAIDGQDMTGIDGNVVISHILGPAGSVVTLTIEREGEPEPFDVSITRAEIFVASVQSEMLEDDIAYVQLLTFGADTGSEMRQALESVLAENPRGIILDLRNNGGGFLDTAIAITSEFVPDGVALYEVYGDGSRDTHEIRSGGLATDIPLVVLVNGGTASASEILAGAIQDYDRGTLVGETTFGKGSVQISPELSNNQGALRVTIANWLTPNERLIHELGLEPDVIVELTQEDAEAGLDPQLERAIEIMLEETSQD